MGAFAASSDEISCPVVACMPQPEDAFRDIDTDSSGSIDEAEFADFVQAAVAFLNQATAAPCALHAHPVKHLVCAPQPDSFHAHSHERQSASLARILIVLLFLEARGCSSLRYT